MKNLESFQLDIYGNLKLVSIVNQEDKKDKAYQKKVLLEERRYLERKNINNVSKKK